MSYPPPPPQAGPSHTGAFPGPSQEERNWALAAHIGTFVAAWFAMGFLCPLLIMLTKGKESAFVRRHAVESLNFQISMLIYSAVCALLILVLIGLFLLPAIWVFALVVIILATINAANGEDYRYPLCLRLVS